MSVDYGYRGESLAGVLVSAGCGPDFAGLQNPIKPPLGARQGCRVRIGEEGSLKQLVHLQHHPTTPKILKIFHRPIKQKPRQISIWQGISQKPVALFCCLSGECVVPYAITSNWDWDAVAPPEDGGDTCCTVSITIAAWAWASKPFLTTLTDVAWCVRTWLIAMPDSIIKLAEPLIPSIDISLGVMLHAIVYSSARTPRNLNGRKVTPA